MNAQSGSWLAAGALLALCCSLTPALAAGTLQADIDRLSDAVEPQLIADRRWLHQHPELSNREVETQKYLVRRLKSLGYSVDTRYGGTGVVATLSGGKPGAVVALRSDMDGLPVVEQNDLPFRSTVRTQYEGKDVGVMHACGHDAHMGILLATASVLAQLRPQLPGTVKLIFQPAEEGAPAGEAGGAKRMIDEGLLEAAPRPQAIFGLHVLTQFETGTLAWRSGPIMASADDMTITVHGKGSHGAMPWGGVDPIVTAAQILLGLQTITSRQMDLTKAPTIVTVGQIDGGTRNNIIPDNVTMRGTLRALDEDMRGQLRVRVTRTASDIAASAGAAAEVEVGGETAYPVTVNDPHLTAQMLPTLRRVAGSGLREVAPLLAAEDFSYFGQKLPALFVFLGVRKPDAPPEDYAPNHSPRFRVDEAGLKLGARALSALAVDYLMDAAGQDTPAK